MRTYDEIKAEIRTAIDSSDSSALFTLADEMSTLASAEAAVAAIHARARAYRLTGAYPEALEQFHRVLAMYTEVGNRVGMASTHIGLGIVLYLQGSYTDTLIHYRRALDLNTELGLRVGEAATLGNIGNVYQALGSYPEALEYFQRAFAIHEELGDRPGLANDACNIGILYHAIGSNAEAVEYYQRSLSLHQEIGDCEGTAKVTHNLGIVHADAGDFTTAITHFQTALVINSSLNNPAGIAHVTGNFIDVLIRSGDLGSAVSLQDQHASMLLTVPSVKAGHFINKARILEHHNDLKGASDSLHDALRIAADAGIRGKVAEIHKHLRELALKQNDLAAYVEHNNEYTRITEEINGKETAARLATQEAQREIAKERSEHQKHLAILHSTLPKHIADRVARGETVNDHFDNAAVIFLDIVDFTDLASHLDSRVVIELLDDVFTKCDAICAKHDVVKIKTIGDSYMATAFETANTEQRTANTEQRTANTEQRTANSAVRAAKAAVEMINITLNEELTTALEEALTKALNKPLTKALLEFRIGIHCGPLTAGVLGTDRMQYDVWGDTVNVASRMESTSEPGKIHVSEALAKALNEALNAGSRLNVGSRLAVTLQERGTIDVKGKGSMQTYWLEGPLP